MKSSRIAVIAIVMVGCSELDPNVGRLYVEPVDVGDAGAAEDAVDGDDDEPPGTVSFALDIRPIIMRTKDQATAMGVGRGCAPCHLRGVTNSTGTALSGFDVTTLGELRQGGGSTGTRIIVPGKPDESAIVQALRGQFGSNRMPKGSPYWQEEEMRLITTWIAEGAKGSASE